MKLIASLPVANQLGEGVIWDHTRQRLWWTDIESSKIYRYEPTTEALEQWPTPERLACFAPIANHTSLIAAFESGFAFYEPESGGVEWIEKIETDNQGTRMNDGRTDRQGRFWAGSMTESPKTAPYKGSLYCLDTQLNLSQHIQGLSITNSLCWSPCGTTMYHCDTPKRTIQAYEFDIQSGVPSRGTDLIQTDNGAYPDGSCVDAQGYLWNAQWGASKVVRYSPNGDVDLELVIPTSQPSCTAFGGANLDLLFVTTARQDLSAEQLAEQPDAGNLLIYQTPYTGLEDSEFNVGAKVPVGR